MKQRNTGSGRKKGLALLLSLCLLAALGALGTYAWLSARSGPASGGVTAGAVATAVEERFDGRVKSDVRVRNTGSVTAYVRVAILVQLLDENGNLRADAPEAGTDYTLRLDLENGWIRGGDGYYYCTRPVAPGDATPVLIEACTASAEDARLQVQILAEGVQSTPAGAVRQTWGARTDAHGTLTPPSN